MRKTLSTLAAVAALTVGMSGAALAQYACPAGYAYYNGVCQPAPAYGYAPSNPVSGAAGGAAAGAAAGGAAAGPVGAIVGGAVGTATGAAAGTVNAATGAPVATYGSTYPGAAPPACAYGYRWYNGSCYPIR